MLTRLPSSGAASGWPGPGPCGATSASRSASGQRHLFLARPAASDVAGRLERPGYLTRAGGRIPWRPRRWVPVDADWTFAPLLRVRAALDPARPLSAHGAVLAGLAIACGLGFRLDQYQTPGGHSLEQAIGQFPPHLRELIAQTQAAIDGAVLAHRT